MIPLPGTAWRPTAGLPLAGLHPATRLGAGLLAVLSALLLPLACLPPLAVALVWLLRSAGWRPRAAVRSWRVWLPLALIVLAAHTLSAVDAAPLGRPSLSGALRGLAALGRLSLMLAAAAASLRLLPLPVLSAALAWWLRPLRRRGVDGRHLNLVLTVAAGTAGRTLAEASRLQACLRLRCAAPGCRLGRQLRVLPLVMPPLLEGLIRQAESLPLALVGRVPQAAAGPSPLPWRQALWLLVWTVLLILAARSSLP